jgi:tRNA C32,U32 (ribose-2'-O)-methylase TrmJ
MAAVMAVAVMAVVILNPLPLTLINLLEQKAGKIEVSETLRKILNLKIVEVEEKEVLQAILKSLKKEIKNPFFEALNFV